MIIVTCSLVLLILLVLLIGKLNLSGTFNGRVKTLFAQSINIGHQQFHKAQLDHLPAPVQRYFNLVLKEGQPYISNVRMVHEGKFKTGLNKKWIKISGEQYATTATPGFIWKGTTSMFVAQDMYIEDKGRLTVSLLSLIKVVDAVGENYNKGELLRWLGESILYPTNLLPGKRLEWFAVSDTMSKFTYHYKGLWLYFDVTFNVAGEIVEMQTERNMDEKSLETWVIKASNYKDWNNVLVPTDFEVLWRLATGDFSYALFNMTQVEYNKLEKF